MPGYSTSLSACVYVFAHLYVFALYTSVYVIVSFLAHTFHIVCLLAHTLAGGLSGSSPFTLG